MFPPRNLMVYHWFSNLFRQESDDDRLWMNQSNIISGEVLFWDLVDLVDL